MTVGGDAYPEEYFLRLPPALRRAIVYTLAQKLRNRQKQRKAKLRQVVPIVTKEESSPLSQPSLNSPTDQTLQKLCGGVVDGNGAGGNATTVGAGWSPQEVARWLQANRLGSHVPTFGGYCGADLLRLSRESLVQLCGLPDGIRMYNTLHARAIAPRLTLYVCFDPTQKVYQAIYLETGGRVELCSKLAALVGAPLANLYFEGPNSIRVIVSDELVSHVPDQSTFTVDILSRDANTGRYQLLLKQMHLQPNSP
ncbi:hypothetical protein AAG570_004656 [Ranatra chinensis]|uniref:SAM domain-containing protein n=1 Tax=Ranatra chinensis TaxID=642074 RepID=A0ABD0Y2X2_9HEMI